MRFKDFSPREKKILNAFADTLIPPTPKIPETPSSLEISKRISAHFQSSHPWIILAFRVGLFFVQWTACFFRLRLKPFTAMSPDQRCAYLAWWNRKRFLPSRILLRNLEVHVQFIFYAIPQIYQKLGYSVRLPDKTPSQALYGPQLTYHSDQDLEEEVDVCIVGSGAGGAVVAKELAERGLRVLVVEEGGRFDLNDFKEEAIYRSRRMYVDAGITTTVGIPPILLPLGRTLGGTTVINSGTCFRTPDEIFQRWRKDWGLEHFTRESMEPYFSRVEKILNVVPVQEELLGESARRIAVGLERLGYQGKPLLRNVKACQGSGLCCFGCPTDAKQSVQLNYLPMAVQAGARIFAQCRIDKIETEGKSRVVRLEGHFVKGRPSRVRIRAKHFVLAAGTIGSVLLLKANRLGNRSGQLGRNLTIHPAAKALALFEQKIEGWKGVPQSYYADFLKGEGVTFEGVFTPPSLGATTLLLHGLEHKKIMEQYDHIASFGMLIGDTARGVVHRMRDGRPFIRYDLTQEDVRRLVLGLTWLSRIFFAAGAKRVFPCIHCLPELRSESEIEMIYRMELKRSDLEIAAFHPLGTARMGVDPKRSVVDEFGKIHELENLSVIDGSVFPTPLGVNPQITIMAFATRAAEHLAKLISSGHTASIEEEDSSASYLSKIS